jgi:hypothetical protein
MLELVSYGLTGLASMVVVVFCVVCGEDAAILEKSSALLNKVKVSTPPKIQTVTENPRIHVPPEPIGDRTLRSRYCCIQHRRSWKQAITGIVEVPLKTVAARRRLLMADATSSLILQTRSMPLLTHLEELRKWLMFLVLGIGEG